MIVFTKSGWDIDPNMLGITCLEVIYFRDKDPQHKFGRAQLMWLYYMYNQKSTYFRYKNSEKSASIVENTFPEEHKNWRHVPEEDKDFDLAVEFYRKHMKRNSLWASVEAYKEAMYNMAGKIANPLSSPNEVRISRMELDELPKSLKKMETQAELEDTIMEDENTGERNIKKGEMLPASAKR